MKRVCSNKTLPYASILLCALLLSCAGVEPGAPEEGREHPAGCELALTFAAVHAGLNFSDIQSFRIRVYASTPFSEDEEAMFDSMVSHGCFAAGGMDVRIQDLAAGDGRFVYYEGFSDESCSELCAVGIRGDISIEVESQLQKEAKSWACSSDDLCQAEIHPSAACDCAKDTNGQGVKSSNCDSGATGTCSVTPVVFVPLYEVGAFNGLPEPTDDLVAKAAQVSCQADYDCGDVHTAAVCDQETGYCTFTGLFPFTPARPRAFHTANALPNGKIMFVGGFNRDKEGEGFYADAPFFEVYAPYTGLFERPVVQDNYAGQNVGMHRSSLLGTDRMVVSGGVSEISLGYQLGSGLTLRFEIPHEYTDNCPDASCVNFSKNLVSANYINGTLSEGTLNQRIFGHRSAFVRRGEDQFLLLTGGLVFADNGQTYPSDQHILCNEDNVACALSENPDVFPHRFSHAEACLVGGDAGEPCMEYLVFGGVDEGEASGEVFSSNEDPMNSLLSFAEVTILMKAHFSELARWEDGEGSEPAKLYSFGGVSNVARMNDPESGTLVIDFPAADMLPQQVNVDLNMSNMTTAALDLTSLEDATSVYRFFHSVTVLDDGSIMVAGGLGGDGLPTKSVLFFEQPPSHALTYVGKMNMHTPRFGHSATVVPSGLLKGAVLIVGGFTIKDQMTGTIEFAKPTAELFMPPG